MKAGRWPWAASAALLLAGCVTVGDGKNAPAYKEIAVISALDLPPNATVIGLVEGHDLSELKDQARARDGDAITAPEMVGMRGLFQSDVIRYK
jgi:hypothetical protein